MKKNLKKVISAVLALTLALSSFVAINVSAATFADVADTASYAEAVNALAALGAIAGYEDGTFLPNNNITRAEVATMVVAALNLSADAQNSGSTTQFADVNANAAWAAGYVNVGVAQGFISGMSATEFAPSENVTYAQMLTMLTRILGYGDFAEARGGYPNGYLTAAATAGILSGVSAGVNDAMTRAQVAQLIWNAVQAPMLDITTFSTSTTGTEMAKMDGKNGRDFRTVLSDKFDAYVLNVTIDKTSKSDDTVEAGKLEMSLTGSNDWDPDTEQLVKDNTTAENRKSSVAAGKTDAENYLFSSAKVVAEYNDDNEWTLIYFAPTTKVTQKVVDGTLVADNTGSADNDGVTSSYIRIRKSSSSSSTTNYRLAEGAKYYVNGVEMGEIAGSENKVQKFLAKSVGDTTLVESTDRSGYYDKVMMDYYVVARVSQVTTKSGSTKINLSTVRYDADFATNPGTSFEVTDDDVEMGDKVVSVVKAGAAAELSSLVRDDVVAIKYNVSDKIDNSKFIEILATTDTVTGKYTSYDSEDEVYTVEGSNYEAAGSIDPVIGTTYTFYLDPFGRLFDFSEEASSKSFAIVERYINVTDSSSPNYSSSSSYEYDYIQVMTLDGQSKTLYIDSNYDGADSVLTDMGIKTSVAATAKAVDIQDRIIEYTVRTSTGRINSMSAAETEVVEDATYQASSNRLGKTLASTAVIIDATNYDKENAKTSDYKLSSLSALTGDVDYDAVLVYRNSDSEYCYAIVTSAGAVYGASSNFAVAAVDASTTSQGTYNDEEVYTLYVMENGSDTAEILNISKTVDVYFNGTVKDYAGAAGSLKQGAVFYYTKDSDDLVDEINVVLEGGYSFNDLLSLTDMTSLVKLPQGSSEEMFVAEDWGVTLKEKDITGDTAIQLVLAPIYTASSNTVSAAPVKVSDSKYFMDSNLAEYYSINSNTKIYSFDMSGDITGRNALSSGSFIGVATGDLDSNGYGWFADVEDEFNFSETIQYAFMMVVDGVVTNALVMMP